MSFLLGSKKKRLIRFKISTKTLRRNTQHCTIKLFINGGIGTQFPSGSHCPSLSYLHLLGYSFALIETESGLRTGFKEKRSDALVYKNSAPFILVECKAPSVNIDQKVFNQAFNYNQSLKAKYLYLTNGKQHIFWDVPGNKALDSLPSASDPNS
ncbi:MAG: type I restriction enzyme HsdR N-terminal domain-containing protein [Flavobacteriia bacterium]|nr:type I restriction enzyme HsdR N-terminal domain-containing protein [Flavobacteriia bacterium]